MRLAAADLRDLAVTTPRIERLRSRLEPLRDALLRHPVYRRINGIDELRTFMEHHIFAVWDFMSLLKALQRLVCCVDVPWVPPLDPGSCRLVNEIVLGEESDEDGQGQHSSHFELYRLAMQECGADVGPIDRFVAAIRGGATLSEALRAVVVPESVRQFMVTTFSIIEDGNPSAIASSFTFGREDLLPDVFRRILAESGSTPSGRWDAFRYYLDRHIEVDDGQHGPSAERLIGRLCGDDPARWQVAEDAAVRSLEARMTLWDGVCDRLDRSDFTKNAT